MKAAQKQTQIWMINSQADQRTKKEEDHLIEILNKKNLILKAL